MPKASKSTEFQKPKGTPCQAVVAATLGCAIGIAGVALFGPVAKHLKEVLELSVSQMSFLIAIPSLSASLLRVPFGAAVDGNGGKTLVLFLLSMAMLGLVGVCYLMNHTEDELKEFSNLYNMLLVCGVLTGCGGAVFSVGAGQSAYWTPPERQGATLGLYGGIGNLPPGLVALGLPFALHSFGMFNTYCLWFCLLATGTAIYFFLGQNAWYFQLVAQGASPEKAEEIARETYGQQMFPKGSACQSLVAAACNIKTWALVTLYFLNYGGYLALTTWFPIFWMEYHGYEDTMAGLLTAVYSEGCCLIRAFLGGPLADRIGGENALIGAFPVVGLGALLLVCTTSPGFHVLAAVIMAASMGICAGSIFKLVPVYVPEALGGAAGWVGGLGAFGSFALPPILALFVAKQGKPGYKNGFLVYACLALMGWIIVLVLLQVKRRAEEDSEEESNYDSDEEDYEDGFEDSDGEESEKEKDMA